MILSTLSRRSASDALATTLDRLWLPDWTAGLVDLEERPYLDASAGRGAFYAVRTGTWRLLLPESTKAVLLSPGDAVVLPHGTAHRLALCQAQADALSHNPASRPCHCSLEDSADDCPLVIYGTYSIERALCSSFESGLPELIHLSGSMQAAPQRVLALLDMIDAPQAYASAGEQATINQLVKVLLLETLRSYARDQYGTRERAVDWLRAALDPEIGSALSLIHSQPEQPWTVQSLAGQIHMSRSAFAERFRQLVGDSPLQYLTKCRMQKAGRMLRETELGVKEIASLAGYESVTSFSSAFKRQTGASPAAFRKGEHAVA